MKRAALLAAVAGLLLSLPAAAHTPQQPPHQLFSEGDLKLESGEAIKDFSISYVTHGTLNARKSNAILMVTAVGGNHHRIDFMIGPGKALDADKYFIVCTDAIANAFTTSPSMSKAQPKAIMIDRAWTDGTYDPPRDKGVRLWRDILNLLAARTPDMYSAQFKNGMDVLPWMEQQETAVLKAFDANDWIYQTWAYE